MMNQLYQGDNLQILRSLPDASVDLICTDPPFNTGKDWGAFDDRWQSLDKYLKFMEARVVEMRRVLKDTGSLYLHCDPTASHYLKVMLDSVFGIKQFRNEIVWCYAPIGVLPNDRFSNKHDVILFYSFEKSVFKHQYTPMTDATNKKYNKQDENGRLYGDSRGVKVYLDKYKGRPVISWWADIHAFSTATTAKERLGYPTQKPLALYARMIKASSNQGDVVLDPFAGSGTTLDAAESLGRKWIGIDIGDEAIEIIQTRLRDRHGLMLEYELC